MLKICDNTMNEEQGHLLTVLMVYRLVRSFGMQHYLPHLVLPLTVGHRRQQLHWCRERKYCNVEKYQVIYSDESRFHLDAHDDPRKVRRRREETREHHFDVDRDVHRTVGVMTWGPIAHASRSTLVFIRNNITALRCPQAIVEQYVLPYLNQQYLADVLPNIGRVSLEVFQATHVNFLPWSPRSPNVSHIY